MDGKLRIGIVGAGGICSGIHLPAINDIDICSVAWICDVIESRAKTQAGKWNIPVYGTDYRKLLTDDKPDAVFILVQPDQAFRIAYDCMNSGCHVFIEKPFGTDAYQADALVRLSKERNVQCQTGFNRRFIPLVRSAVGKVKQLGEIYQIDGYFFKNSDAAFYGGCSSAYMSDVVHVIDLLRFISESEATEFVQFASRCGNSSVINAWNGMIAFENGVTGTVRSNYATGGRVHGVAVHGAGASAYINLGFGSEPGFAKILYSGEKSFSRASAGIGAQDSEIIDIKQAAGSDDYYKYYGYYYEDRMFVESVLSGRDVPCGAEDAAKTMHLLEMMQAEQYYVN